METMSGFMLLTFWLCAGVNYIMLRNMSKRQKGPVAGRHPAPGGRTTGPGGAGRGETVPAAVERVQPLSGLR